MDLKKNYNERLFQGWQSIYHLKRFYWLQKKLKKYGKKNSSFIEFGCFDAKTLDFIPSEQLGSYLGLDANWENGLDIAKKKHKNKEKIILQNCSKPEDIKQVKQKYNIGISLETFEHVSPKFLDSYLKKLASSVDGYFFITIPVERGFSLFVATIIRTLNQTKEGYSPAEWVNAFLGRMHKVKRREHKGFDDRIFIKQVSKYFDIKKIEGVFFNTPFYNLNLSVGIIAKSKK